MNAIEIEVVCDEQTKEPKPQGIVELTTLELALVGGGTVSVTYL